VTCSSGALSHRIVQLLTSPLDQALSDTPMNATVACDNHVWRVSECAVNSSLAGTANVPVSRALCVDCLDPCTEYDCLEVPGNTVVSPCAQTLNCPHLQGSTQIFTAYYGDSGGHGNSMVLTWYGTLWGIIILSVLGYNRLFEAGYDIEKLRSIPRLSLYQHSQVTKKSSNFKAILPEPPMSASSAGRPSTGRRTALPDSEACQELGIKVHAILDRLTIAAGQTKALYTQSILPVMQTFRYRMLSYNHYLAPYTRLTVRERFLHGLNILTRVTWLMFCVALCMWYNYPEDDDSCYYKTTVEDCGERVTDFNSNQEYCEWVGMSRPDAFLEDGGQALHQAQCLWRSPSGDVITALQIIVLTLTAVCIPRIVYTTFLLDGVLFAPGGQKKVFAYHFNQRPATVKSARSNATNAVATSTDGASSSKKEALAASAEEMDSRFYSLTLTENKGGPTGYLESGDAAEDISLIFRSFMFEFTKYRNVVMAPGDEASNEFETEWTASNPFIWSFVGTLSELTEELVVKDGMLDRMFPTPKIAVAQELAEVHKIANSTATQYRELLRFEEDQFAVRMMLTFLADLLGKDSIQCRLIQVMLRNLLQDSAPFRDVRNWLKFCVIMFFIATNICLVYGSVMLLEHFAQRRQWYWVITAVLAILVDMVVVESVEALWFQWTLPLCVADTLAAARQTLVEVFDHFEKRSLNPSWGSRSVKSAGSSRAFSPHPGFSDPSTMGKAFKDFSMPNYQFVATNVAHRFPRHIVSRIILSYESVYPRTITAQRWPYSRYHWSSGLGFESVGYVLFSCLAMCIGTYAPTCVQQLLLTGLVSLTIWLLSWLALSIINGELTGVYIFSAVIGMLVIIAFSYRFSWDHDSEHYELGVEALHVEDIVRDLRTPASPFHGRGDGARRGDNSAKGDFGETYDHFPEPPRSAQSVSQDSSPFPLPWNPVSSPPESARKPAPDSPEFEFYSPPASARHTAHTVHFPDSDSERGLPSPPTSARPVGSAITLPSSTDADGTDLYSPPTSARAQGTPRGVRFPEEATTPAPASKSPAGAGHNPAAKKPQVVTRQEYYLSSSSDEEEKV
jgi:hypothetical protein